MSILSQMLTLPQLGDFLNFISTFRELRELDLWTESLRKEDIDGGDGVVAKWIMGNLHSSKLGVPFDLITIHHNRGLVYEYKSYLNSKGDYVQLESKYPR
jgi:hypothetical protein